MIGFGISGPGRILFGCGEAAKAPALIATFGARGVVVCGANPMRSAWLLDALQSMGVDVLQLARPAEPTLAMLEAATTAARS